MTCRRRRALVVAALLVGSAVTVGVPTATASSPAVQVSSVTTTPTDPVAGQSVTFETTVSNLERTNGTVQVTDVYLRRTGSTTEYARLEDVGSIAPGGQLSVPLTADFEQAGDKDLTVSVVVKDSDGHYHRYSYPAHVEVATPSVEGDIAVEANTASGTGVTLTNYGNVNFTDVEVTAVVHGDVRDQRYMQDIPAQENRSVTVDTGEARTATITARYTADDSTYEVSRTVELERQLEGAIRLTSVDVTPSGEAVSIDGEAANVGGTDVQSVLLAVQSTESTRPRQGSGEFFVGQVEASEFATFELRAAVDQEAESVPIETTYIVDDERVTTTRHLDITPADVRGAPNASDGGSQEAAAVSTPTSSGGLLRGLPVLGIVALVVVLMIITVVYRRRDR